MATRNYWAQFGSSAVSGLAPTFVSFITPAGANGTPPSISEPGSKGLYLFQYDASLTQIAFTLDGATSSLAFSDRYIYGVLDQYDTFGVTLNAIGTTLVAQGATVVAIGTTLVAQGATVVAIGNTMITGLNDQGSTLVGQGTSIIAMGNTLAAIGLSAGSLGALIGDTNSLIGNNLSDPTTVFGFLKRAQETREGDETYTKASGVLDIYDRTGATLLRQQTISDTATQVTRT